MIRVAFDYQTFLYQRYGGISRYFFELARHLAQLDGVKVDIVAPLYANLLLTRDVRPIAPALRVPRTRLINRLCAAASDLMSTLVLPLVRPDIIHETYYLASLSHHLPIRRVVTIHDMIPEKLTPRDGVAPLNQRKRQAVERASHVCCVSHTTKQDLIELSGISEDRVTVTYLASSDAFQPTKDPPVVEGEYILFVGGRGGYKNALTLLEAYCRTPWLHRSVRLVFFGGGRLTATELALAQRHHVAPGRLLHLHGDDKVLSNLYTYARAFVCPSLYEGFGITLLEAMRCGCPVIASTGGALPEVAGEAAEFFDPRDAEELTTKVQLVLQDSERAARLRYWGLARTQGFSWARCARETLAVYQLVSSEGSVE